MIEIFFANDDLLELPDEQVHEEVPDAPPVDLGKVVASFGVFVTRFPLRLPALRFRAGHELMIGGFDFPVHIIAPFLVFFLIFREFSNRPFADDIFLPLSVDFFGAHR